MNRNNRLSTAMITTWADDELVVKHLKAAIPSAIAVYVFGSAGFGAGGQRCRFGRAGKLIIGFRNIAVHEYQSLLLPITVSVITEHLDEFLQYAAAIMQHDAGLR